MGMMQVMDAKDIRWSDLQGEFDAAKFCLAVVNGQDPEGRLILLENGRYSCFSR